jgi:uncharacterized Zn finger protein
VTKIPYVEKLRQRRALREMEKLKKKGHAISPITVKGRELAKTFWGKAWCRNLEQYSDFKSRLPRGRNYLRSGYVLDLQIGAGEITGFVMGSGIYMGSDVYRVKLKIRATTKARWRAICSDCAGEIGSLVELLQGRLAKDVMERLCKQNTGLFPTPKDIELSCSCPDWARMCKHVAAILYGVGSKLDDKPELLFRLHKVDETELIARAGKKLSFSNRKQVPTNVLDSDEDLSALFGLDIVEKINSNSKRFGKAPSTVTSSLTEAVKKSSTRAATRRNASTKNADLVKRKNNKL